RYHIAANGTQILDQHRFHRATLEFPAPADSVVAMMHTSFDSLPADTDVLYVPSARRPSPRSSSPNGSSSRSRLTVRSPGERETVANSSLRTNEPLVKSRHLSLALLLFTGTRATPETPPPIVSTTILPGPEGGKEAFEPSVAIDPADPNRIVVAAMYGNPG